MRSDRASRAVRAAWLVFAVGIAAGVGHAAGGDFDPSFSGDGWLRTLEVRSASSYSPQGAEDVAIQRDGKIVVVGNVRAGTAPWNFGVFRYLPDGSLDRSFAGGGWVVLNLGSFGFAHAVALQRDGKIVVAGEANCPRAMCFAVARFLTDGSLDRSFGEGGSVRTMFAQCGCSAYDVAVQPDGRIVAVGWRFSYGQNSGLFAVARYLPDGRLDRSFSRDGLASIDVGLGNDFAQAVAVQPDGKIVVAGRGTHSLLVTGDDFAFARLRRDGTLDRGFGGKGLVIVDFGGRRYDAVHGIVIEPNGAIVAAGSSSAGAREEEPRIALLRLRRNGSLDRTFGSGGRQLTSLGVYGGYAHAVLRQPDGRIVVAGRVFADEKRASDWVLARYGAGGKLDGSFGRGGIAVSDFGTGEDSVEGLALDREGRIVAAGSIYGTQALARYRAR